MAARLEHPLVVGELDQIPPAPLGLEILVGLGRPDEERLDVRGDGPVRIVVLPGPQGPVVLDVHRQVATVRRARIEGVGPDEEVGLAHTVRRVVDGKPPSDHQWGSALHGAEGQRLPITSGEISSDRDRIGDGRNEHLEDLGLEASPFPAEHLHEGRAGQRLAGLQDVQLHRLRTGLRQVRPLRGYLAHGDHGLVGTGTRLRLACLIVVELATVAAHEVLDGMELLRQQSEIGVRGDQKVGDRQAPGPIAGGDRPVLEVVDVIVNPDQRSRVALHRPADGQELPVEVPLLGLVPWGQDGEAGWKTAERGDGGIGAVLPAGGPVDVDGEPRQVGTHGRGQADHEGPRVTVLEFEFHVVDVEGVEPDDVTALIALERVEDPVDIEEEAGESGLAGGDNPYTPGAGGSRGPWPSGTRIWSPSSPWSSGSMRAI